MTKPGEEPMARSDFEELETDRVNAEPGTVKPPKEAPRVEIPLSIVDAEAFARGNPNGEAESVKDFEENLEAASRRESGKRNT